MEEVVSFAQQRELQLVTAVRKGDSGAFEALYRAEVGRIYALCLRLCGNVAEAEEYCQEVFVRAWQKIALFKGEARFGTWLHRLAANWVIGHLRKKRVDFADLEEAPDIPVAPSHGDKRDLEQAMARLPEGARTIFILAVVEGYTHEETAAMLGVTVGTSKAQVHRAKQLIAGWLQ